MGTWSTEYKQALLEELQEAKDDIRQLRDALQFYAGGNADGGVIARRRLGLTPSNQHQSEQDGRV